jgi:hypothetical protein
MFGMVKKSKYLVWVKLMNTPCYLSNRKPTIVLGLRTLKEMYMCKKSNLSNLRVFGTLIHVHALKENKIRYLKGLSKKS